jgi:hypothetical protein
MANREDSVFLAKLAEQSERYDEMYDFFVGILFSLHIIVLSIFRKIANLQMRLHRVGGTTPNLFRFSPTNRHAMHPLPTPRSLPVARCENYTLTAGAASEVQTFFVCPFSVS